MIEYIDKLIDTLTKEVGSNNLQDILSHLNITVMPLPEEAYILNSTGACYIRNDRFKVIWYSDGLKNKDFAICHELAHMLIHDDGEDFCYYNPLENKLKQEKEADYFATRLLYSNLEIEDGIETYEQLANRLGIEIDNIKYIIK